MTAASPCRQPADTECAVAQPMYRGLFRGGATIIIHHRANATLQVYKAIHVATSKCRGAGAGYADYKASTPPFVAEAF